MRLKSHPTPGARPGTLVPPPGAAPTHIRVHDYDPTHLQTLDIEDPRLLVPYVDSPTVTWVEIRGLRDVTKLARVGEIFGVHPLAVEDTVNVPVRPKTELTGKQHLTVLQMVRTNELGGVERNQISLLTGERFLITVQERDWGFLEILYGRMDAGTRIRERGPDYLAYAVLDLVVDSYFPALELLADSVDALEAEITENPRHENVQAIMSVRKNLQVLRRALWPTRDVMRLLLRDESIYVSKQTHTYLRDSADHVHQAVDTVEGLLDMTTQLMALHSANMGNTLNETMKTLTIISSIFIPLGFLAGLYGMNFRWMPELYWKLGYPVVLGVMVCVAVGMLYFFRRKGWIGRD